jgi:alkylated DNA repair dioxygenase AlkB
MSSEHYEFYKDFLYLEESDKLLKYLQNDIPWTQVKYFKPERGYVITPRLTWVSGFHQQDIYDINGITPNPIPDFLLPLKDLIEDYLNTDFNYMLFCKYRDQNDSITYHSDDEAFLGKNPTIASITLGCPRPFVLKNKKSKESESFNLSHGDLFVMKNNCQKDFFHAVPKQKKPTGERFSITFRKALNENGSKNYYKYNLGKQNKPYYIKET